MDRCHIKLGTKCVRRQSGRRELDFLKWKEFGRDKGLELIAYDLDLGLDNPSGEFMFVHREYGVRNA